MTLLISYDKKTNPINLYLLHIVEVCPKHFIFNGKKHFFTDKRFETSNKEVYTKCTGKDAQKVLSFSN